MPLAGHLEGFLTQLIATLARFVATGSVIICAEFPSGQNLRSISELNIALPDHDSYGQLRQCWKAGAFDQIPKKGLLILDEDLGTANSIMTLKFVCKPLSGEQPLPYTNDLSSAILRDGNDTPYGYISEYSYSFYPDINSEKAKAIGYMRYDFHPSTMGDGDLGAHPYCHFHGGLTGEELEEIELDESKGIVQRQHGLLKTEFRLPTGIIMPEAFLTVLESALSPKARRLRIENALSSLEQERSWYYLMMDLTPSGVKQIGLQYYTVPKWNQLLSLEACKLAMAKNGWRKDLLEC